MYLKKLKLCYYQGRKKSVSMVPVILILIFIILLTSSTNSFANAQSDTLQATNAETPNEAAYRIKPILDKLAALDNTALDAALGKFTDMGSHWSRLTVGKLIGLDIVTGAYGKYMPDAPVQADQFIKMTVRAMGYKIADSAKNWAQPYIEAASGEGFIIKGDITDYTKPITREQMARIIVRAVLKLEAKPDSKYDQYIIGKVTDYPVISDGLKQYVIDAYRIGMVTGSNNKFNPKSTLTRAEAATVIIRLLDAAERKPMAPTADEIIKLPGNDGSTVEYFPGAIREYFDVAKAMQNALPKIKGYANFSYNTLDGGVGIAFYRNEDEFKSSPFSAIGDFGFSSLSKNYELSVYDVASYKILSSDYIREVLKTLYGKEVDKAIQQHDKYLNMNYTRTDGLNECTSVKLNNRVTEIFRYNQTKFAMYIKLLGVK